MTTASQVAPDAPHTGEFLILLALVVFLLFLILVFVVEVLQAAFAIVVSYHRTIYIFAQKVIDVTWFRFVCFTYFLLTSPVVPFRGGGTISACWWGIGSPSGPRR